SRERKREPPPPAVKNEGREEPARGSLRGEDRAAPAGAVPFGGDLQPALTLAAVLAFAGVGSAARAMSFAVVDARAAHGPGGLASPVLVGRAASGKQARHGRRNQRAFPEVHAASLGADTSIASSGLL